MSLVALAALEQPKKHSPLPNSYWVVPGRLAAGEHPAAATLSDMADRLQRLLFAGITMFIDLTEEGEAASYEHLLVYATGVVPLKYVRYEMREGNVPSTRSEMIEIIQTIDTHLAQGGTVYVHGKLGIGRAATVIGCYLVRLGLDPEEAIDRLNEMWYESELSQSHPCVPQAKTQFDFIKNWHSSDNKQAPKAVPTSAPPSAPPSVSVSAPVIEPVSAPVIAVVSAKANLPSMDKLERFAGALIGMAIGEALGAQLYIEPDAGSIQANGPLVMSEQQVSDLLEGGAYKLPRGAWLSDTAMCWCLAESYLSGGANRPEDQLQRYLNWQNDGVNSSTGVALHIPIDVTKAVSQWQRSNKATLAAGESGTHDAHALARTTAVVLAFANHADQMLTEAVAAGRVTTNAALALDANRVFAALLFDAVHGVEKETMLSIKKSECGKNLRRGKFKYPVLQIMDGWWRGPVAPACTGQDALAVLKTALWAFERTSNFRDAVLTAVNNCRNASSSGAVCGALAGAFYGMQVIPQEWRSIVLRAQELSDLAHRLAAR